ncbi:uracil-DNA glycosylase (plasmid) [Deinococcus psychrotolerans]|uniref:Uracil-DNA glycosylase n=1 Tax=Deinococcus psychrotolerans TaxID=2489213 RepID=A0A3G8YJM2_9DEIO|nr:uracil-DNA glycosylase [Deinococcus psychrotolerans]AZI45095.1 uracil-DNA glycosylase [Deinococcus psychrotolerans]
MSVLSVSNLIPQPVQLVWFKKDLRINDHAPLVEAAARGPVLPLYIYEPEQLAHEEFAGHHLMYLNDCLHELSERLRELGTPLIVRVGEAVSVMEALREEVGISGIWAHEETGNAVSYARDQRVRAWARERSILFHELPQNGVVRRMTNRDGWADTWEERLGSPPLLPPTALIGTALAVQGLQTHAELGVAPSQQTILPGGERAARDTLSSFLMVRGVNYMREMSSPLSAEIACSRLSAPLAFGTLSLRETLHATRQRLAAVSGDPATDPRWVRSLRSYESRLHWHCHFIQRLESEPEMEFQNLNRAFDGLREHDWNPEFFDRWAHGQTGFPLIDACMRMLVATGWLNFRMRAMLVSFASQHLWLHWRPTGVFLARQWLDNEPGIHWSQMQMQSAVVGINRVRIYSPTRQAKQQDPAGEFIRCWVPELQDAPSDFIHAPWEWSGSSRLNYPTPIVDEGKAARAAKAKIMAARAQPQFEPESRRVYALHGSRKKAVMRAERVARGLPPKPVKVTSKPPKPMLVSAAQPALFGGAQSVGKPIHIAGLPDSWREALAAEFAAPYFHALKDFLVRERAEHAIYPPAPDVFSALRLTPLEEVKVLILGQDPYHGHGQAQGLSFSVRPGVRVPPSLQNIYKELHDDLGITPPRNGDLTAWATQGVLLLNAVLTVRAGQPNSHANQGWEPLTDAVIRAVNAQPQRVVFVLWGAYARKKAKLITAPQHVILESAHPSPYSAEHFFGIRPFSRVNAALEEAARGAVVWSA